MNQILLLGAGPIPDAGSTLTCSYNLRTAKLAHWLAREGFEFQLAAVDIFNSAAAGSGAETRTSLAGNYLLFSRDALGQKKLAEWIRETAPKAILATSYEVAATVCEIDHDCPVWADMPGWIMAEAQLKAASAGDDVFVEHFLNRERTVLSRADVISVVSRNQRHATLGELALLGRLTRRNAGYDLVRLLPSLAMDWRPLLGRHGAPARASDRPQLPPEALVLLWSGGYNLWTDPERIFSLLTPLMRAVPNLHFVSTGGSIPTHNDQLYGDFLARVAASEFSRRLHLLPWLPFHEALDWYGRAALGICVDGVNIEIDYGSRTRVVDMLAHGLAVATTTGIELCNDLARAGAIIALDPAAPQDWARAIEPFLADPARRAQLAQRGQAYIQQHYALDAVGLELRDWLKNPRRAPDLVWRERLERCGVDAAGRSNQDGPLPRLFPLVTWEPQREVEAAARQILDPYPPGRTSQRLQKAWRALLANRATVLPALVAWWMGSRALRPPMAARWQSRLDAWNASLGHSAGTHRLANRVARSVYASALRGPLPTDSTRAVNILLARHEYDRIGELACFPQRIEIEPSSACNIRCRVCKLPYLDKPALNMSRQVFAQIEPCLKYAATLEIIGEGEPTLNPDLPLFLEAAAAVNCQTRMFTNGTRLTPELSAALVRAQVDTLVFSICAGDREAYRQVTGADLLEQVIENIRDLREIKRLAGSLRPRLGINCPLIGATLASAPNLVRLAGELGIERMNLGVAMIFREAIASESLMNVEREKVRSIFTQCADLGRRLGVQVLCHNLDGSASGTTPDGDGLNRFGCLYPWQSVRIRADGVVESCTYNRKILGDLNKNTLGEIWNGPEARRFRAGQASDNGVNHCRLCYHRGFRAGNFRRESLFVYDRGWNGY